MYRANADYQHKPYKKYVSGSDMFYACTKIYIVLFTALYISTVILNNPFFQINRITIRGAHSVSEEEVKLVLNQPLKTKKLFFWSMGNEILYPSRGIETKLLGLNPKLLSANVSVTRKNIYVDLVEYEPSIRYCLSPLKRVDANNVVLSNDFIQNATSSATSSQIEIPPAIVAVPAVEETQLGLKEIPVPEVIEGNSHDCYWADKNGHIFAPAPSYLGLPILTVTEKDPEKSATLLSDNSPIGKNIFAEDSLFNLNTIINLLKDSGLQVRQVLALTNDDITLDVGYPFMVTMNLKKKPSDSVDHLLLALKELEVTATTTDVKVKFLDVRFSNKVFYR